MLTDDVKRRKIKFLAINCWHPGSSCRNHFSKLHRFPAILVYLQTGPEVSAVQYKGLLHADHLISFLTHILNPIIKIDSTAHLSRFRANNDGLVVLCADLETAKGSRLYRTFYSVALKFLEYDSYRDVKFAVVLNSRVSLYLTSLFPSLVLLNFNNSVNYKGNFTDEKIIEWILNSLGSKPVNWINLSGTKSMTLNYYLRNETSLVLFTPRNLLRNINIYYNIMKIIAADFHKNCGVPRTLRGNTSAAEVQEKYQILMNYLGVSNIIEFANDKILSDTCEQLKMKIIEKIIAKRKVIEKEEISNLKILSKTDRFQDLRNQSFRNESLEATAGLDVGASFVLNVNKETGVLFPISSPHLDELFNTSSTVTSAHYIPSVSTVQNTGSREKVTDKYSILNLLYENSKHMCKVLRLANKILKMPPTLSDLYEANTADSTGGTANAFADCTTNKSMNFLSMDSKRYKYFLDNLNIDLSSYKDETLAIIVDVVNDSENIYLLNSNITRDSLVMFIKDYLDDKLMRYKRNNDISLHSSTQGKVLSLNRQFAATLSQDFPVLELNAKNFFASTHNASSNVLVLFYSKYCGQCHAYSHVFYLFSHLLKHIKELRFVRIDGDTNDLSYPFIPGGFPAVILFPARRPENSVPYNRAEPFTQTSLLRFLLAGIPDSPLRIQVYASVCLKTNVNQSLSCLENINSLIHSYLLRCKLHVYRTYAQFPLSSQSYTHTMTIKKYLIRMKYFRSVQTFIRNSVLPHVKTARLKLNRALRILYSLYGKCDRVVSHINAVYSRLNKSREPPKITYTRLHRLKEEL